MLDLNPKTRITIEEALKHSFLSEDVASMEEVKEICNISK